VPRAMMDNHVIADRHLRVCTRRTLRALHVGTCHNHTAVEAAGPQQRRIRTSGRLVAAIKITPSSIQAVHFNEQRVQRLLALIVSAAETGTAMPPDRVNFVDEDDARRILLPVQRDRARGSRPRDEHFHKIRTGNREEGTLASPAIARASRVLPVPEVRQATRPWEFARQLLELLRIFQNSIIPAALPWLRPSATSLNVASSAAPRANVRGLAETQCLVSRRLHLPHQEQAEAHQKISGAAFSRINNPVAAAHFLHLQLHGLVPQAFVTVGASSSEW